MDSLKLAVKASLQQYIEATKKVDSLKYINPYFFEQLLLKLNADSMPKIFPINSYNDMSIGLQLNARDTTFSYEYNNYNSYEHYFKNCWPNTNFQGEELNLIVGTAGALNLVSIDTISNVIITKPTKKRYQIYYSVCKGNLTKQKSEDYFMQRILGQYQLEIIINNCCSRVYFIAPPSPKHKFRIKNSYSKL